MDQAIVVEGFRKSYGDAVAVDGIDFVVSQGEVGAALAVFLAIRLFQWDRRAEGRRVSVAWGARVLVPYVAGALLL